MIKSSATPRPTAWRTRTVWRSGRRVGSRAGRCVAAAHLLLQNGGARLTRDACGLVTFVEERHSMAPSGSPWRSMTCGTRPAPLQFGVSAGRQARCIELGRR